MAIRTLKPVGALLAALCFLSPSARGALKANSFSDYRWDSCVRLFDEVSGVKTPVTKTLSETRAWRELYEKLLAGVDPHSKQPFSIRGIDEAGEPVSVDSMKRGFAEDELSITREPRKAIPPGGRLIRFPRFGYHLSDGFREIGPLTFIVTDATGRIVEIGAPTAAAMSEFLRHLSGVELTPEQLARISELNRRLLNDLRGLPAAREKLAAFAKSRNWPAGLAEEGKLAYFDPSVLDVKEWARRNGFSMSELIDAGWYRLVFDRLGHPKYILNSPDAIKIPYLAEAGKNGVPVWRSRNLTKSNPNLPKYTGWQIDRSVIRSLTVAERLYNGWKLPFVKGKTVVITEGEFKCLVAEKVTGIPMFGIPGISEFDDGMAKALVDAGAEEYIVILDRDPHAKALFRADEVTDSNRAAYTIAKQLEAAGAKKVYVGTLPEMADGEKLGIDDLVLKYGAGPVEAIFREARSTPADVYAKKIGLDPEFQALSTRRSKIRKAIEIRKNHRRRIGVKNADPTETEAKRLLKRLNATFKSYLENELNGARSIDNASGKVNSIRPGEVPHANGKKFTLRDRSSVGAEAFADDLILLDYVPAGAKVEDCRPLGCGQTPFSRTELEAAYSGDAPTENLRAAMKAAEGLAEETGFTPTTLEEFSVFALAGQLTRHFPVDEYRFEFGGQFMSGGKTARNPLPLTIFKRISGNAVAIADLHLPADAKYWSANIANFDRMLEFLRGERF